MLKLLRSLISFVKNGRVITDQLPTKPRGVALILVLVSLAFMGAAVGELSYNQFVLYRLAIYERDAAQAESLAAGGLNLARLFLVVQDKLQAYLVNMAELGTPLPEYAIWNLLPLDSHYLRLFASGQLAGILGVVPTEQGAQGLSKKPETFAAPPGGYGGFQGEVTIKIHDEESKISVSKFASTTSQPQRNAIRKLIYAYLQPQEYDYLFEGKSSSNGAKDRQTLIANIFSYLDEQGKAIDPYGEDASWGRTGSGTKTSAYRNGVKPKNAYFDSFEEMRLVPGMTDEIMDVLNEGLTSYGEGGKINFYTAGDDVLEAALRYCTVDQTDTRLFEKKSLAEFVGAWNNYKKAGQGPVSPVAFMKFIESKGLVLNKTLCGELLDNKSANFRITSTATVGEVTRKLTLIARIAGIAEELYYFSSN